MTAKRCWLLTGVALLLLGAAQAPKAPAPLPPAEAIRQGRELVARLLSQKPAETTARAGVLTIRPRNQPIRKLPVRFELIPTETNWSSVYVTARSEPAVDGLKLTVIHKDAEPNRYLLNGAGKTRELAGNQAMVPFAGSDFWVADLGLEFLHWPDQRVLRKELRRGQSCDVLESINPEVAPGAYARVISWIDIDSGGIICAEAFDARDRLLKEFIPKSVKKVAGQWELQEMEMNNRQTGSRTWIEFNLDQQ